ncbi:MAG: hypothetical protein Q9162_005825 [Coniocarpon cinnabarinum]
MAPPSKLTIATSAVSRLLKEEATYHKEEDSQIRRIQKFETEPGDENQEFMLRQERQSLQETKAVFGPLRTRIENAVSDLKTQIAEDDGTAPAEETSKAQETLKEAQASLLKQSEDQGAEP